MIDLSFLTEEEQETILAVLKRDAELKKAEEQRVQNLQKTVSNRGQLRYLTGEWFYETKQLRHQDRIHGSDIIRASMRHTHKPLTILELSQILPEKSSFVSSENKEVFVPPVLCGLLQEPYLQLSNERYQKQNPDDTPQDTPKPVLQSPTKRKNPFNIKLEDRQLLDRAVDQTQTPNEEPLPSSDSSICYASNLRQDPNSLIAHNASVPMPMPENKAVNTSSQDCFVEVDGPGGRKTPPAAPQGILKHFSTSSSTDSLFSHLDLQSPVNLDSPTETWLDKKQVRFSTMVSHSGEEWQDGEELGEHRNSQTYVESIKNLSVQKEMTGEDTAGRSQEKILSPQTGCSLSVHLSKEDGTYRANPVLIYEETDDSLTGSVPESGENSIAPKQQVGAPVSPPRQPRSSPQKDRPAKISDLKHFWESEYTGPRVIAAKVREASSSSVPPNKVVTPQSDPTTSLYKRETYEEEAQTSQHKTNSSEVLKSLKLTDKGFFSEGPDGSQLRSPDNTGDAQSILCHQYYSKADTESQERPLSPSKSQTPKSKDQEDEVRRSPSKTYHPRVLPRESSSPERSRLEGSPLKTFPIDIEPQTKVVEEQQGKPSPSHGAKQTVVTDTKPCKDITSSPLPLHPEDRGAYFVNLNTQQSNSSSSSSKQYKKSSEKKLGTFTSLARSFINQDFQHYLGPQEKAHVPPFHQDKGIAEESDAARRPQSALSNLVGNHSYSPTEGNPTRTSSWIVQKKEGNSSQDTTRAWSLSRASPGSYDDCSSPVMSALKRLSLRSTSSFKSLENLTSQSISSLPPSASTLSNSEPIKSSVSVPVLQQDETDSDSTFETNLGMRRNTGSSTSNISLSSGMASMLFDSSSISSLHHADFGDIEIQGNIQLAVNYIQKLREFHIFVVHCRELAIADTKKNRSDPYVKCYLLPDKTKLGKRKTTVKKKTLNPTYNEILRFKVIMEVLKTQNLNISVWHNDTFGQNSFLGEVELDLSEWDFSNTQINEYTLKARVSAQTSALSSSHLMDGRGLMKVALRFLPQTTNSKRTSKMATGEVQIWVKDCKKLPSVRGEINPFVKCTVLPDTSWKSRQKTRVVKRTANPMFNHTMVYDGFRTEDLREACVEITVWDHERLSSHYIGGLRLGLGTGKSYGMDVVWMDSTTDEANLWQRMLQSEGEWVEDVLPLRMLMLAKSMSM
ncbi:synaptotagmin-like protein 2 isoform X2 [Seriola lalandi dorsalis]|uniref:synaptotagmin-like protein 2 isoform X2 n=1 Tax=Seriola lalandi dorsalis TaxID=1841481 RepID=UPI000C6FC38B|nr:synaptotagmin-like protein 2 isoform X2 [Seriola lalandi dorsalis]